MKTNLWKLSCMAWAMAAIVTGCNQNNELGIRLRRVKKMY